ncbi:MAG: hypothetical protein COT33_00865 [Candidatus Nealsonbacteria bacterium CG08_land_8_20_14_0_20_38_20]|uniref:Core-binding (CB) domain-containing protein n=1 Tax=Candidatus Nealsonbacteria bacterium CG08_land_8_20_14_0_20_38_20 TaxID=1974705 RepID=A0A2H0YMB2_9BACT|nr:MAG: hypothetical protein COT33_00865 [Candidatus Nealsonbacteria bacterium CG08_land_8_20_14_0_20_38_20]
MNNSSKPIIEHIPLFLSYCKETGLADKTQKNYKHYLKRFIRWIKKENKNTLLPHEFTLDNIQAYKEHLSHYTDEKGHSLKKITQNYYLIALRALLRYFTAKDIESLLPDKISLLGGIKSEKRVNFLSLEQISAILKAPNINEPGGLRDRAIFEVLISTGLKVAQLEDLNRTEIEQKISDQWALSWVKQYLESRKDDNDALFINYRCRRNSDKRLSPRSIERIVKSYGRKIGLPFLITPEALRWAKPQALLKEEIIIKKVQPHKTFIIKSYSNKESIKIPFLSRENKISPSPAWHIVEKVINEEVEWLKNNIPSLSESYKQNPLFLRYDDSILRKISILTVSGKVKAVEFIGDNENKDLWDNLTENKNLNKINRHGELWHKKIMDVIHEYFKLRDYKIILEPVLNCGRADLGIYLNNNPLFVEVGTVSLFKLWYNLSVMKNVTFLIIPSENKAIELST